MDDVKMIKIFEGTLWEAEMIKSMLEAANIDSFLKNTALSSFAFEPIGSERVQVMISDADLKEAGEIVNSFQKPD